MSHIFFLSPSFFASGFAFLNSRPLLRNQGRNTDASRRSLASSAIAPAVPALLAEYHSSDELAGTLIITIELMGTAVGPLVLAPLSELYGRQVVYNIANLLFCAFTVGCALSPSPGALVALRFLQGCAASCAVNNAGGTIGDIVPTRRRGAAMSLFSVSILFGPVVGPIAGSYLAAAAGWRWIFWLLLIMVSTPTGVYTKVKANLESQQR